MYFGKLYCTIKRTVIVKDSVCILGSICPRSHSHIGQMDGQSPLLRVNSLPMDLLVNKVQSGKLISDEDPMPQIQSSKGNAPTNPYKGMLFPGSEGVYNELA